MQKQNWLRTRKGFVALLVAAMLVISGCAGMSSKPPEQAPAPAPVPAQGSSDQQAVTGSGNLLDQIVKKGEIVIGMGTTFPPWGYFNDKQELTGYDVDVAKDLANALGVKPVFVDTTNANRIPYLLTGKVDIVVAVFGATPERAKSVAFSDPYAPFFLVMATRPGLNDIRTAEDLKREAKNLKIATTKGTTSDTLLQGLLPGVEYTRYENPTDLFLALRQGKHDVGVEGYDGLAAWARNNSGWTIQVNPPLRQTFPTIGVRRGEYDMLNWINIWIRDFTMSGRNAAVYEKHFGASLPNFQPRY
jgi:polar amino acid transport system substrate-binding protein